MKFKIIDLIQNLHFQILSFFENIFLLFEKEDIFISF
jgi:hypothetical protein